MGTSPSLISELDAAIQSSSSDKRIATLRRVTDLFLSHAGHYDPEQMKLFDGVLMRMIGHMETRALAELGGRLAPVEGAPVDVIRHLANHDEIVVAGPVLKDSKQLTSDDLVDIHGTAWGALQAVAAYVDHAQPMRRTANRTPAEARFERATEPAPLKDRALELLTQGGQQ